jgi:hypothetical protein
MRFAKLVRRRIRAVASIVLCASAAPRSNAQTDPMLNKGSPTWDANYDGV